MKMVSIIIPVYNAEKYLAACLDSIIQQTYPALEIIIMNDGSTDNSEQIAEMYSQMDERITLFHQHNSGPGAARNQGIKKAKGEYIQFVDADDQLKPDTITKLVQKLQANTDLIIYGYEQDERTWSIPMTDGIYSKEEFLTYIGRLYQETILPSPCNKLYRRSIMTAFNLQFPENKTYGEDLLFNLNYIKNCHVIYMYSAPLYMYRKHDTSITNSYITNLYQKQKELHQALKRFLQAENSLTDTNEQFIHEAAAQQTIYAATNLFTQVHPKQTVEALGEILTDPDIKLLVPYLKEGAQAKLFSYFIRHEARKQAYLFFWLKSFLKKVIRWKK